MCVPLYFYARDEILKMRIKNLNGVLYQINRSFYIYIYTQKIIDVVR
jgi:hypothetical protein